VVPFRLSVDHRVGRRIVGSEVGDCLSRGRISFPGVGLALSSFTSVVGLVARVELVPQGRHVVVPLPAVIGPEGDALVGAGGL